MQSAGETVKSEAGKKTRRSGPVFVLLALILLPVYANTFSAAWQFDDSPNIVKNKKLHIKTLDSASFRQVLLGTKKRILPVLSFALNWYVGQDQVAGYHVVNIAIHLLTTFLLYLTILALFQTPLLKKLYEQGRARGTVSDDAFFVAFFSAALWAVNPIQTQAVTYIVQRMAEMAALFYLSGMFFYLKARLSEGNQRKRFSALVVVSFFGAVLSKENAIMLPASLVLLEQIFFSGRRKQSHQGLRVLVWAGVAGLGMMFFLAAAFNNAHIFSFLDDYGYRPFSLTERVLTEPRIVLFYLSLIFYPLPARLSIAHDVALSTSLFSPWTTSVAIAIIAVLISLSWKLRHKMPLLSFAMLFFFINHIVESTIVPLELIFEHRNYLPSLFLFAPFVAGVKRLSNDYMHKNKALAVFLLFCLPAVTVGFGRFAYERNQVWQSPESLWLDALSKTRNDARAATNMAIRLAWGKDVTTQTEAMALSLFQKALQQDQPRTLLTADLYGNMAAIFSRWGETDKALSLYKKGLEINPNFTKNRYDMIKQLVRQGRWDEAQEEARQLVDHPKKGKNPDYYNLYGFILLWQNRPAEALPWLQQALAIDPYNFPNILLNTGYALSRNGYYKRAEWYYKYWFYKGRKQYRPEIAPYFLLIENSVRSGNDAQALLYARNLLASFDVISVLKTLKTVDTQHETVPMDKALIAPVVKSAFYGLGEEASQKNIF